MVIQSGLAQCKVVVEGRGVVKTLLYFSKMNEAMMCSLGIWTA